MTDSQQSKEQQQEPTGQANGEQTPTAANEASVQPGSPQQPESTATAQTEAQPSPQLAEASASTAATGTRGAATPDSPVEVASGQTTPGEGPSSPGASDTPAVPHSSAPIKPSSSSASSSKIAPHGSRPSASSSPASGTTATSTSPKPSHGSHRKRMKLGDLDLSTAKIGFLGAGKMAESTINGLIHYAKIAASRIHVAAPTTRGLERFKALGCRVTKRNYDIFGRYDCDVVFLCFHGYVIKHCYKLGGNKPHPLTTNYIPHQRHPIYILSLVSGVSLAQIRACLLNPESTSHYSIEIHRIMMNTAVGHGLGICAIDCEPDSKKLSGPIRQLLSSIAQLEHVPASQMDAACAVGGSGLAFSYYFINALADGAFRMGLSRQQAIRFASKTAQCAAQTMLESGKHPAELRDNVSAPSGAAIYGLHVLEKNDVASGVTAAVEAAHKRANDLANQETN